MELIGKFRCCRFFFTLISCFCPTWRKNCRDSLPSFFWNLELSRSAKVVQVLLKHGADATYTDKDGTSVLNAATAAGNRCNDEVVLALLAVNGILRLKFDDPGALK